MIYGVQSGHSIIMDNGHQSSITRRVLIQPHSYPDSRRHKPNGKDKFLPESPLGLPPPPLQDKLINRQQSETIPFQQHVNRQMVSRSVDSFTRDERKGSVQLMSFGRRHVDDAPRYTPTLNTTTTTILTESGENDREPPLSYNLSQRLNTAHIPVNRMHSGPLDILVRTITAGIYVPEPSTFLSTYPDRLRVVLPTFYPSTHPKIEPNKTYNSFRSDNFNLRSLRSHTLGLTWALKPQKNEYQKWHSVKAKFL